MAKAKWIKKAIKHPGALKEAAAKAGETTHEYAEKHKGDEGTTGHRARMALTLEDMSKHRRARRAELYNHPRSERLRDQHG